MKRKLSGMMMSVTLRPIPVDLWARFKAQAVMERETLPNLIIRVVSDYLKTAKVKP